MCSQIWKCWCLESIDWFVRLFPYDRLGWRQSIPRRWLVTSARSSLFTAVSLPKLKPSIKLDLWITSRRFLTKAPCAISCGAILMNVLVMACLQEVQASLLARYFLSHSHQPIGYHQSVLSREWIILYFKSSPVGDGCICYSRSLIRRVINGVMTIRFVLFLALPIIAIVVVIKLLLWMSKKIWPLTCIFVPCSFVMNLVFNLILLPVMRTLINNPKSLIISCNIIRSLFDPVVFCLWLL